jgi:glucose-6-phosphate isomerase
VTEALATGRTDARMEARFLSNVDGHAFQAAIQGLGSARTLFLGVELAKELAGGILAELEPGVVPGAHDASTTGLIARFRALRGET